MECLQIDWKNIDATFERDEFYESIQAPRWIDFTAPLQHVDDHEWFCGRAGCMHEKKIAHQTEDSVDSGSPKSMPLQIAKKVASAAESIASAAGGKRARAIVSSSYSSVSGIKEAFAKHKALHVAKMPRTIHASENQNPNRTCKAQVGIPKTAILKTSEGLTKNMKLANNKQVFGKPPTQEVLAGVCESTSLTTLKKQVNHYRTRALLDVSKSTSVLGMTDIMHKKSTLSRDAVEVQDRTVLRDACRASESQSKKDDASRIPFSVYASRFAVSSSLAMPSKQTMMPARSIQSFQVGTQKVVACIPPRIVARKAGAINVQTHIAKGDCKEASENALLDGNVHMEKKSLMQGKHMIPTLNKQKVKENAVLTNVACMQKRQMHASYDNEDNVAAEPMVPCSTTEDERATLLVPTDKKQPSHCSKENEEGGKARHGFEEMEASMQQDALEEHLEKLYLSTPSSKHCGAKLKMGRLEPLDNISEQEILQPQHADSVVDLQMVSLQIEEGVLACKMEDSCHVGLAAEHNTVLSHHADTGLSFRCSLSSEINQSSEFQDAVDDVDTSALQMRGSCADGTHSAGELPAPFSNDMALDKNLKQLHPVKDWQRTRGLKRKSSELNFKVNCSSKDHIHVEHDKATTTGAAVNSLICQQTKQSSLTSIKAAPSCTFTDSCKEQHKKIKTTKPQSFKPFRLRTEERGALRERGLGKKEQAEPISQELVHRALRMPSFGHPFRPQRSTKKLTVPKEPSFHSSRMRKSCADPSTLLSS